MWKFMFTHKADQVGEKKNFNTLHYLIHLAKPRILVSPQNYTIIQGTTVTLTCNSSGNPQPIILWMKEGHLVLKGKGANTLTFDHIKVQDSGRYQCISSNLAGNVSSVSSFLFVYCMYSAINLF